MAIIKCKMCGGDLNLIEGASTAECEFCGSRQTVPTADNEKKLTLFGRANRLRATCEFDKAAGIYESIVADFPEEAEAYWGLVLCKYGIEYVDDPATGKKIPTCHRSSFDSVMDDSNFEQAMENSDEMALRVYREEAKQIERIRKGILEVSSNEQPYDIFICYKETDYNGDRTVDSLLAQNIYDVLTEQGYRVFFSRITLEDKLGQAYEPFIFAALNSSRIMLAVGTCYEYYNAVWVKNEWSRYLKIIAQDKNKYLIPCYKGIDAYDIPKEFAHLQGQDMGKVGALQDLLRGIEKILPKKEKNTVVVQERVVVGGSGDNKIASLLDRGNMALEDGDWAKADSFFEDVLNNDSKNAQAYLGKTLAQERCRTIDAFVRKRKDASQNVCGQNLSLEPNHAHVNQMVDAYSLTGYVEQSEIQKLYDFDLSYRSNVAERKQQYKNEETYWANHKWLSRAEKFAAVTVAANLATEKKVLFAALADRVKQAESAESAEIAAVKQRYEKHLKQADEQAQNVYNDGIARREADYQKWLQVAKTSSDVRQLTETAEKFESLGDYQDSKNLAEHCRKRAAEEQAKLDAAKEARRIADAKAEAERKKKNTRNGIIISIAAAVVLVVILVITKIVIPANNYEKAEEMLAAGQYEEAVDAFAALGNYRDSRVKYALARNELDYNHAARYLNNGDYDAAIEAFSALGDYKDAADQVKIAEEGKLNAEQLKQAEELENTYQKAEKALDEGNYDAALAIFSELGEYKDSQRAITYCTAQQLLVEGDHEAARTAFLDLGDYRDASAYVEDFRWMLLSYQEEGNEQHKAVYQRWGEDLLYATLRFDEAVGQTFTPVDFEANMQEISDGNYVDYADYMARNEFNEDGLVVKSTKKSGGYFTYEYRYNANGTIAETIRKEYYSDDRYGGRISQLYTYDGQGRVSALNKTTFLSNTWDYGPSSTYEVVFHYDENGEITSADFASYFYSYNATGRVYNTTELSWTNIYNYGYVYLP